MELFDVTVLSPCLRGAHPEAVGEVPADRDTHTGAAVCPLNSFFFSAGARRARVWKKPQLNK